MHSNVGITSYIRKTLMSTISASAVNVIWMVAVPIPYFRPPIPTTPRVWGFVAGLSRIVWKYAS